MASARGEFSSRLRFVLAAARSAVGLGNIWNFPTQAASNGGAAFLLVYLVLAFTLAYPALMAELIIGRHAHANAVQALQRTVRLAHDPQALAWAFDVAGLACMPDLRPALAAAQRPVHFLTGALDVRFGALAASVAHPPCVTHGQVGGAGHNLLLEAPGDVAASLACLMENP